jgi:hypothetical protein
VTEAAYILLGWLLGLLAPAIVERIRRTHRAKEVMAIVLSELQELQTTMATVAHQMRARDATVTDKFLDWYEAALRTPTGRDLDPNVVEILSLMRKTSEAERRHVHLALRETNRGLDPREYELPFLKAHATELSICPLQFQVLVWRIGSSLSFFNQHVRSLRAQFDKTFDPGIAGQNREVVLTNLKEGYTELGRRAESITDKISDVLKRWS